MIVVVLPIEEAFLELTDRPAEPWSASRKRSTAWGKADSSIAGGGL